jgi:hypothetical protein
MHAVKPLCAEVHVGRLGEGLGDAVHDRVEQVAVGDSCGKIP